jgi:hypothetical protein
MAGDVLGDQFDPDNTVTSPDALLIQQYFVSTGSIGFDRVAWSFWKTNDFVNANPAVPYYGIIYPTVTVNAGDISVSQNFWGLVTGDYNRSYVPALKSWSPTLELVYDASLLAEANTELSLPIRVSEAHEVGAVSLILHFPADLVEVTNVIMNHAGGQLDWAVNGDELRIGWNTRNPLSLNAGAELLTLQLRTQSQFVAGKAIRLTLANDPLNELADASYSVIPSAVLLVDVVESSTYGVPDPSGNNELGLVCQPNPFAGHAALYYTIPMEGHVVLRLTDELGRRVALLADERMMPGTYRIDLDNLHLQPGVYTAALQLESKKGQMIQTLKVVRGW